MQNTVNRMRHVCRAQQNLMRALVCVFLKELAAKHRQASVPVYEVLHHTAHGYQEKLAAKKAAAMEEELKVVPPHVF